jgi:hypothetical protein
MVRAVQLATHDWVALIDSDNTVEDRYFEPLISLWREETSLHPDIVEDKVIYCPAILDTGGRGLDYSYIHQTIGDVTEATWDNAWMTGYGGAFLNTGNFIVPKKVLEAWEPLADFELEAFGMISMVLNYFAVRAGFTLRVVPNMTYTHRVHGGSLWMLTEAQNKRFLELNSFLMRDKDKLKLLPVDISPSPLPCSK